GNLLVLSLLTRNVANSAIQGLRDIVGDGLLTTDGEFHDRHRHVLQPAFARSRVENQAGLIVQYTEEALERWPPHAEMDLARELQALILRITLQMLVDGDGMREGTALGRVLDGMLANPVTLLEGLLNLKVDVPFLPYGRRMRYKREADEYIDACIERRLT